MTEAQQLRSELGDLYNEVREAFMVSTVPLAETELAYLEDGAA